MAVWIREHIHLLVELVKIRIIALVSISCAAGYILAKETMDWEIAVPFFGILCLAGASAAMNQLQDSDVDGHMQRTMHRPLPSQRIGTEAVIGIIFSLSIIGVSILYIGSGVLTMMIGLSAMLMYNAVYTPMKRRTAFAVIPGAVIGAIPPMVGWVAGGGNWADPQIMLIAFFLFIWQIPHFWLLFLDSEHDYRRAGLPVITDTFSHDQIKRLTFIWMMTAAVSCLMILNFTPINYLLFKICLLAAALLLIWKSFRVLLSRGSGKIYRTIFVETNIIVLFVLIFLSVDKLIHFI
ncbi:MAG: protoheme IX farnesyltransferase [candidate division KSB1 bacterium]|jgi:protoheme IX farnesyltransferase|nr:protoheme IX farnesyltransferase [candidate division KSB1 bacterium]